MSASIDKIGKNSAAIKLGTGKVYMVSCESYTNRHSHFSDFQNDWESYASYVQGKKIVPYGPNDNLPQVIRDVMGTNHIAPGIIERRNGLIYGQGPLPYETVIEDGKPVRKYTFDKEIDDWWKSFDSRKFIEMSMTEFAHMKGVFVRRHQSKGWRIGRQNRINELVVVPSINARLAFPEEGKELRLENVPAIYTGDFPNLCTTTGITTYPIYKSSDPFKHEVAMNYHNSYTFAYNFYSMPSFMGTLKWLMRSSETPDIIEYLTINGISAAWHIHSPAEYWDNKKIELYKEHSGKPEEFINQKLDELKDELFESIARALTGKKNAGKFIETVDFLDPSGNRCEWKIEPLDQKIKDFIEAQVKVSDTAVHAAMSGMNLHPSLANVMVQGKLSSGSEMLYALKLFLATDVSIPEEIIFEPVNQAIAANWPGKNIKIGFYRDPVSSEQDTKPNERLKNSA
ncbi:hypothetical protein [Sphingobacterium sp.]|uniref:hypothetical protein n=2 Tax=Sphingobacterium TaxID=28453 RepID=UPI002FDDAEF2